MKLLSTFMASGLFLSQLLFAQTPAELAETVKQLKKDVAELRQEVQALKAQRMSPAAGLKTEDLNHRTFDGAQNRQGFGQGQMSSEQREEMMKKMESLKKLLDERDEALKSIE
ncbi:MAG: hypothetical protein AB1540_00700 [Bdellovibrionota bacterium]